MEKKIQLKDIAKELGISPSTVSQALNNPKLVNRKTRKEILELCNRLGFIRKKYKKGNARNIGVLGESFYAPLGNFYNRVTLGILQQTKKNRLDAIINTFEQKEETIPTMITKRIVDGIIVVGKFERDHVLQVKQENIPIVLCGNPIPGTELHTVIPDGRSGIYQATKHLIDLGHKRIATITGGDFFDPIVSDRLDGYRFALSEAKIRISEKYTVKADFYYLEPVKHAVEQLLKLKNKPTAIVCQNDSIAYTAIKTLLEKGVKVPKDISVTGFDDIPLPPFIDLPKPELTTVHINLEELGAIAVDILLDVIDNPTRIAYRHTIPTNLVIRKTTFKI